MMTFPLWIDWRGQKGYECIKLERLIPQALADLAERLAQAPDEHLIGTFDLLSKDLIHLARLMDENVQISGFSKDFFDRRATAIQMLMLQEK